MVAKTFDDRENQSWEGKPFVYKIGTEVPQDIVHVQFDPGTPRISKKSFKKCNHLSFVKIPEDIRSIGEEAFYNCSSLKHINLPSNLTTIEARVFSYCSSLKSIYLPQNLSSIGIAAFSHCCNLLRIDLPKNLSRIEVFTFQECSNLKSINFPKNLSSIGAKSFSKCSSLESVSLPDKVSYIEELTFYKCTSLSSVSLPANISVIGEGAFCKCSNLMSITLPHNINAIEQQAFYGCSNLTNIFLPLYLSSIGAGAFSGCSNLTSVSLPPNLSSIEEEVFSHCSSLKKIIFPSKLSSIGKRSFYGCSNLVSIILPSNLSSIGDEAFCKCKRLLAINIPDGKIKIGSNIFLGCDILMNGNKYDDQECFGRIMNRFRKLPLHSLCSRENISLEAIKECISKNTGCLEKNDEFGFTALHVLAINPSVSEDTLKLLIDAFPGALTTPCSLGMLPQHLLLYNPKVHLKFFIPDMTSAKTTHGRYANSLMNNDNDSLVSLAIKLSLDRHLQFFLYSHHPIDRKTFAGMKRDYKDKLEKLEQMYLNNIVSREHKPGKESWNYLKQHGWVQFLTLLSDETMINDISAFIKSKNCSPNYAKTLAFARDHTNIVAIEIACQRIREALEDKALFIGRFLTSSGSVSNQSDTCIFKKAVDMKSNVYFHEIFNKFATDDIYLNKSQLINALNFMGEETTGEQMNAILELKHIRSDGNINERKFVEICKECFNNWKSRKVVLKFMKHQDQFLREVNVRFQLKNDLKYIVPISSMHQQSDDRDTEFKAELENCKSGQYKFLVVMPLADRNFEEIIRNERLNNHQIRGFTKDLMKCLEHLHNHRIVHGNLKPSNVVRFGTRACLIDFSSSSDIYPSGKEFSTKKSSYYIGKKFSSGSLPPEMIFNCEDYDSQILKFTRYFQSGDEYFNKVNMEGSYFWEKIKPKKSDMTGQVYVVKTFLTEKIKKKSKSDRLETELIKDGLPYEPVKSSSSIDLWGLGTIIYYMSSGQHLFDVDINGDLKDGKSMEELYMWSEEKKEKKLSKIDDPLIKSILRTLLAVDPNERKKIKNITRENILHPLNQTLIKGDNDVAEIEPILRESKCAIIKPNFITSELNVPTCFIILPFKNPYGSDPVKIIKMGEYAKSALMCLLKSHSPKDFAKKFLETKFFDEPCFIYLIDEYDYTVADQKQPYPIKIEKNSEISEKALSIMSCFLTSLLTLGDATILAMIFFPEPSIEKKYHKMFEEVISANSFKSSNQQEMEFKRVERGNELRALQRFILEKDKGRHFSGLIRVCNRSNGSAMWISEKSVRKIKSEKSNVRRHLEVDLADAESRKYIAKLISENSMLQARMEKYRKMSSEKEHSPENAKDTAKLVSENEALLKENEKLKKQQKKEKLPFEWWSLL